jgi:hypothetical protein
VFTTPRSYTVEDLGSSLRFVFPYRYIDFITGDIVIGALLIGIFIVFVVVFPPYISQALYVTKNLRFVVMALVFLLFFMLVIISFFIDLAWQLNGTEVVEINGDGISICHQVFVFSSREKYNAEKISCVFISRQGASGIVAVSSFVTPGNPREMTFHNFKRGKIAFNYGKTLFGGVNTFRFGSILDQDETKQVVAIIHQKFPPYRCVAKNTV